MKVVVNLALSLIIILLPSPLWASEFLTTRSFSMGGAFHALADDNSAITFNPAGMSRYIKYSLGGNINWANKEPLRELSVSIVDTKTSVIGAGLSYTRIEVDPGCNYPLYQNNPGCTNNADEYISQQDRWILALSYRFYPGIYAGLSARYLLAELEEGKSRDNLTGDAGFLLKPIPYLSVGLAGHNLIGTTIPGSEKSLGTGLALSLPGRVNLSMDLIYNLATDTQKLAQYRNGVEITFLQQFALRGGYIRDRAIPEQDISLGVGWNGPRLNFSYGLMVDQDIHSLALHIYF